MAKKILNIILIIIISVSGYFGGLFIGKKILNIKYSNQQAEVVKAEVVQEDIKPIIPEPIKETTLMFVGDMMFDRGIENTVKNNFGGDFNKLFENISEIKNADILFGNLEGPVSNKGNNVGSKYSFEMNPIVINTIQDAGFDIVSFANNHVGDWNVNAFVDTIDRLGNSTVLKTGAGLNKKSTEEVSVIERNGVRFGFLGFSDVGPNWMEAKENSPGILLASDPRLGEIVQNAKAKSDILIVSFHFGDEYKKVHNKRQEQLAKLAIDSGADLIIGHHPHVAEDIEIYKSKPIVYSLGNFIFDQYFSKDTMKGMLFEATYAGKNLKNFEAKIIPLNKKYQPEGIFTKEEQREREEAGSTVCAKPSKEYEDMFLHPVDQNTKLKDIYYVPKILRELDSSGATRSGICLIKEARDSFENLASKAKEDGYIIKASSGFRSYELQKSVRNTAIKNGSKNVDIAIAKPGYSEHQIGTAVDVTSKSIGFLSASDKFDGTDEAMWMKEHAREYGFVESYPVEKTDKTGYMYEPWHYRFVGIGTAKEVIDSSKTLNEYLGEL